jgi:hypothetical protein
MSRPITTARRLLTAGRMRLHLIALVVSASVFAAVLASLSG